jgi:hypothetical protein
MKTTDVTGRKRSNLVLPKANYMVIQNRGKAVIQPNFVYILKQRCWWKNEKKVTALSKLSSRFRDFGKVKIRKVKNDVIDDESNLNRNEKLLEEQRLSTCLTKGR